MKNNTELIAEAKMETAFNIYRELNTKTEEFKDKITALEHSNETTHIKNMGEVEKQHAEIINEIKKTLDGLQKWIFDELHVNVYSQDGELLKNYQRMSEVDIIKGQLEKIDNSVGAIKKGLWIFCSLMTLIWAFVELMLNNDRFAASVLGWLGIR